MNENSDTKKKRIRNRFLKAVQVPVFVTLNFFVYNSELDVFEYSVLSLQIDDILI